MTMKPCTGIVLLLCFGFTFSATTVSKDVMPAKKCVHQTVSRSLTYLVDTTGSMFDDVAVLRDVNDWLLAEVGSQFPCGVWKYTMVQFNDPSFGTVQQTNSITEFKNFFNSLSIKGGGDCPEMALSGLKVALQQSPYNSVILVMTDAPAKDYNNVALKAAIDSLISTTESQVFFLITSESCPMKTDPGYPVYLDIASKSFGHVFHLNLATLPKAFLYVKTALSRPGNTTDRLLSREYTTGSHTDSFTVAKNFAEFSITTSGTVSSVKLTSPDNKAVVLQVIMSESWGSLYRVKKPRNGKWQIVMVGADRHSVRVEGYKVTDTSAVKKCSECDTNASCEEVYGTKICTCKDGFIGDGIRCSDINECAYSWLNNCTSSTCINTVGSFSCGCKSGYTLNSKKGCVDIDECSNSTLNSCHRFAICTNTDGSYNCSCSRGFEGNGLSCKFTKCKDVKDLDLVVNCNKNEMKASFAICQLKYLKHDQTNVRLADVKCTASEDGEFVTAVSPLEDGKCGTKVSKNSTHITYRNTLFAAPMAMHPSGGRPIIKFPTRKIFECSYPLKKAEA
ncbi:hemicentin-2 [Xenopus laevis]|uniref:Uncharacterized protein n=2 Tax=Xenopus laevis TaxID=8355 RepID=A0A974C0N7_XENLA|nr:hemicentin-2 [Xenopus laevis]OCT64256.1 hypothetical protein XELAEV_18045358mg [Xenopus laevis]